MPDEGTSIQYVIVPLWPSLSQTSRTLAVLDQRWTSSRDPCGGCPKHPGSRHLSFAGLKGERIAPLFIDIPNWTHWARKLRIEDWEIKKCFYQGTRPCQV
jgi:hypothetical protein